MNAFNNISIPKKLMIAMGLILIASILICGTIYLKSREVRDTTFWNDHTLKVIDSANSMVAGMVNQETGYRGFLLSGEDHFLDPYRSGWDQFNQAWTQAKSLTSDNPAQQTRLDDIRKLAETWHNTIADRAIRLAQNPQTRDEGRQIEISGAGKTSMDGIRKIAADMIGAEKGLLTVRQQAQENAFEMINEVILGGMAANVIIAIGIGWLMTQTVAKPIGRVSLALAKLADPMDTGRRDEVGKMQGTAQAVETAFREISEHLAQIAIGDLSQRPQKNYGGLASEVGGNLSTMVKNLNATAAIAAEIAEGDLTVQPKPLSEKDILGQSLETMVERLRAVVADAIAASDNVSSVRSSCRLPPSRSPRARPSRPHRLRKPPRRWRRWPPTSSRTPTTPHRPKRSRASRPRTPNSPAMRCRRPSLRWASSLKRSASCRKSPPDRSSRPQRCGGSRPSRRTRQGLRGRRF